MQGSCKEGSQVQNLPVAISQRRGLQVWMTSKEPDKQSCTCGGGEAELVNFLLVFLVWFVLLGFKPLQNEWKQETSFVKTDM